MAVADGLLLSTTGGDSLDDDNAKAARIQEVVSQLKGDFSKRDRLYGAIDKIVYLEDEVTIPSAYQKTALEIHSPLPLHIPTTITAALSINPPRIQYPPVGRISAITVQENATKREHFFEASWRKQEEDAQRRLFRAWMFDLIVYGEGILKTVQRTKSAWAAYDFKAKRLKRRLDDESDPEYGGLDQHAKDQVYDAKTEEWKRGLPYPILSTDVAPGCFYSLKSLDGMKVVAEVSEIPYFEALERYSAGLDGAGNVLPPKRDRDGRLLPDAVGLPRRQWSQIMGGYKTLQLVEYWDWEKCTYVLLGPNQRRGGSNVGRGTVVREYKHGYGNPWTHTLRGPYFHAQGITTSSRLPHHAAIGVLTPFLELFPQINSLLTVQGNAAYLYGFPSWQRTTPPGAGEPANPFGNDQATRNQSEADVTPGKILPYGIGPVEMPKAVEIDKFIEHIQGFVELALPRVLQGQIDTTDNGYLYNQAAHMARLGWDPIASNAEVALGQRTGFESWLIANRVRETVYVMDVQPGKGGRGRASYLSIGPDDLGDNHTYNVKLDPETPSNKVLELRYHEGMLNLKLETPDQAIEATGGNPDEVEEGWLLWEMKQDPAIKEKLKQRVMKQLGTIDQGILTGNANQASVADIGGPAISDPSAGAVFAPGTGMPMLPSPGAGPAAPQNRFGPVGGPGPVQGGPPGVPNPPMQPGPPFGRPG